MGHHLPKFSHKYDIITFGGVGRVSSWDREGNANWQVRGHLTSKQMYLGLGM